MVLLLLAYIQDTELKNGMWCFAQAVLWGPVCVSACLCVCGWFKEEQEKYVPDEEMELLIHILL